MMTETQDPNNSNQLFMAGLCTCTMIQDMQLS